MQVKPKSLIEVEENLEREKHMEASQSLLGTKYGGPASSQLGAKKPELKTAEREIFDKPRYVEATQKSHKSSVSSDFLEQQKMMRTQRELETSKKFLQ